MSFSWLQSSPMPNFGLQLTEPRMLEQVHVCSLLLLQWGLCHTTHLCNVTCDTGETDIVFRICTYAWHLLIATLAGRKIKVCLDRVCPSALQKS